MLSKRLRPNTECAQWVFDEVIGLERALASAKLCIKAQEKTIGCMYNRLKEYKEAAETLASERECNALLTDEIQRLQARLQTYEESKHSR